MCPLQPCKNPTEEGVWWRDTSKWCLYNSQHEELIKKGIAHGLKQVDLGTIVSHFHPKGTRYVVDLVKMEQVAKGTGNRRPVMVVEAKQANTELCKTSQTKRKYSNICTTGQELEISTQSRRPNFLTPLPSSFSNLMKVHYRDWQGNSLRYDSNIEEELLRCMMSSTERTLLLPDGDPEFYYFFDFDKMEQSFVTLGAMGTPYFSDSPVQVVVEIPSSATVMAWLAAEADKQLRRMVLNTVIQNFSSDNYLNAVLSLDPKPRRIAFKSTSTYSAEHYERFIDSVEGVLQRLPKDVIGELMSTAGPEKVNRGPLRIAFRPVECSRKTTFSTKLEVEAENRNPELWMSMAVPVATAHAALKLLAYLVILPVSAWKASVESTAMDACFSYGELNRPEHGLPLAEVTVM